MSSARNASGNTPATSARPPVFTIGQISEVTDRTRKSVIARHSYPRRSPVEPVDHRLRNKTDAVGRHAEMFGVELWVLADDEPLGNLHAAIDHHILQPRAPRDGDVGHHHRAFEPGMRMQ